MTTTPNNKMPFIADTVSIIAAIETEFMAISGLLGGACLGDVKTNRTIPTVASITQTTKGKNNFIPALTRINKIITPKIDDANKVWLTKSSSVCSSYYHACYGG